MAPPPAAAALLAAALLAAVPAAAAAPAPTPEARAFNVVVDADGVLAYGFAAALPSAGARIGMAAVCDRGRGRARGLMHFGGFPPGKPVQPSVRGPGGRVTRHGRVVVGGPRSGFHDPVVEGAAATLALVDAAFREGALLSNGHNSVWNRVPEAENARVRRLVRACVEALPR